MNNHVPVPDLAALGAATGAAIGRHLDRTFRALVRHARRTEGPEFLSLLTGEPHPFGNFAVLSSPVDLDATREAVDPLVADGFPAPTALPAGHELVRVGAGDDGEEWVRQFAVGYELPLGVAQCFSPVAVNADTSSESTTQFFAIRRKGTIVCTSTCYLDGGLAGIYCVSTIPEERRKGLAAHATAEPLRLASAAGYRVGVLQSSEAGHSLYKSLGFVDFGPIPLYVRLPVQSAERAQEVMR